MTNSHYKISLDIHEHGSNVSLKTKRGDTARTLYITLTDGRNPYIISEDSYAVLTAKKADGTPFLFNHCSIIGNMVSYTFTPKTCAAAGKLECEIKLYGADSTLLTSASFSLVVEDTISDEEIVVRSEMEVTALTKLISDATALIADVTKKLISGAFKGEKGDRGATGNQGPMGERGPQGVSYVATKAPSGYFALELDSATGDFYCVAEEGASAPTFTLDENGNLYHEIKEV